MNIYHLAITKILFDRYYNQKELERTNHILQNIETVEGAFGIMDIINYIEELTRDLQSDDMDESDICDLCVEKIEGYLSQ